MNKILKVAAILVYLYFFSAASTGMFVLLREIHTGKYSLPLGMTDERMQMWLFVSIIMAMVTFAIQMGRKI